MGIKTATIRRANFELGITDLGVEDLHVGSRILYYADGCNTFAEYELDYIIFARKDIRFSPNKDEIKNTKYVSLSEFEPFLKERLSNG